MQQAMAALMIELSWSYKSLQGPFWPQQASGSTASGHVASSGSALYVAASAHATGSNATNWRTDLGLHAVGAQSAGYTLELLEHGSANGSPRTVSRTLDAGRCVELADLLETEFGFTGKAALRITPTSGALAITSRTYNLLAAGNDLGLPAGATFGQFIPAAHGSESIAYGDEGLLVQLAHDPSGATGFRTNLGLLNVTALAAMVEINLQTADGSALGRVTVGLAPYEYHQVDRIFERVTSERVADGTAVVRTTTEGAAVLAYASVVDNLTGDPVAMMATPTSTISSQLGRPLVIAAGAHAPGAAGTNWRTDLEVHNAGTGPIQYSIDLLEHATDNSSPRTASFTLEPGRSRRFTDVLAEVFSFTGQAALRVTPDAPGLVVTSRTYNLLGAGNALALPAGATFGQFIPAAAETDAISAGDEGRLIQLRQDERARTNLILVNATGAPLTIEVELHGSDGGLLGTVSQPLTPFEYRQLNRAFELATSQPVPTGFAVVRTATSNGAFFALASVVDNRTGDPVAIPAAIVRRSTPPNVEAWVERVFEMLRLIDSEGGGNLEDAVALAQSLGPEGLASRAVQWWPGIASQVPGGFRLDVGDSFVGPFGDVISGTTTVDLSGLAASSDAVTGPVTLTSEAMDASGEGTRSAWTTSTMDLDVSPTGTVTGDIAIEGGPSDAGEPGAATTTGTLQFDTAVCLYYPIGGTLTFDVDGDTHTVTFGPQCDGTFDYQGPEEVDFSQYHSVTVRALNLSISLRSESPACSDIGPSNQSFIWNSYDGTWTGNTYHYAAQYGAPPAVISQDLVVTPRPGAGKVGFTAWEQTVDSQDPEHVVTTTVTITGHDLPMLFTGYGYETRFPGTATCNSLNVSVRKTSPGSPCVYVVDSVTCRDSSGVVVTIQ